VLQRLQQPRPVALQRKRQRRGLQASNIRTLLLLLLLFPPLWLLH
jgi:hypothetical protein